MSDLLNMTFIMVLENLKTLYIELPLEVQIELIDVLQNLTDEIIKDSMI